mmetsp:Transcript_3370/g.4566  ORF Transcript_3370/g.4566 Transcript_3370/m.4566 type:complete len:118 (-) Transcript_3370:12-365(-)
MNTSDVDGLSSCPPWFPFDRWRTPPVIAWNRRLSTPALSTSDHKMSFSAIAPSEMKRKYIPMAKVMMTYTEVLFPIFDSVMCVWQHNSIGVIEYVGSASESDHLSHTLSHQFVSPSF